MMNPDVKRAKTDLGWADLDGLYRKLYPDYQTYLAMQASKLDGRLGWCRKQSDQLKQALQSRLKQLRIVHHSMSVLCLGARLGGEVEAFLKMGAFAVGIDINPGDRNPVVMYGDFHHIQFADNSIDLVYTNSFDHCLEPTLILAEIHRVLKSDGIFMLESKAGSNDAKPMGSDAWDCMEWESVDILRGRVCQADFKIQHTYQDATTRATPYGTIFRRLAHVE